MKVLWAFRHKSESFILIKVNEVVFWEFGRRSRSQVLDGCDTSTNNPTEILFFQWMHLCYRILAFNDNFRCKGNKRGRRSSPPCCESFCGLVCLGFFFPELFCQMLNDEVICFVMRKKFSHWAFYGYFIREPWSFSEALCAQMKLGSCSGSCFL